MTHLKTRNNIEKLRKGIGYSRVQLAEVLGLSKETIKAYERHNCEPSQEIADKLCLIFHCVLSDIFYI